MDSVARQDQSVIDHVSFEQFNAMMMSQVLTIGVKVIHQTRTPGKVDASDVPTPQVIEVGRALQKVFQKLFEELEAKKALTTIVPMMTRQAPLYTSYVEQLALDIEKVYDASVIIKSGMEVNHG